MLSRCFVLPCLRLGLFIAALLFLGETNHLVLPEWLSLGELVVAGKSPCGKHQSSHLTGNTFLGGEGAENKPTSLEI